MKRMEFFVLGLVLLGFTGCMSHGAHTRQITKTIQDFSKGADNREVARVASAFHGKSQQFFLSKGKVVGLSKKQYLKLLSSRKIGGVKRHLRIHRVKVIGEIASARATMENATYRFDNLLTLMKVSGKWKIVNNVLKMTKKTR